VYSCYLANTRLTVVYPSPWHAMQSKQGTITIEHINITYNLQKVSSAYSIIPLFLYKLLSSQ